MSVRVYDLEMQTVDSLEQQLRQSLLWVAPDPRFRDSLSTRLTSVPSAATLERQDTALALVLVALFFSMIAGMVFLLSLSRKTDSH